MRAQSTFNKTQSAVKLLNEYLAACPESRQLEAGGFEIAVFEKPEDVFKQVETALTSGRCCGIFNPQTACSSSEGKQVTRKYLAKTAQEKSNLREIMVSGPEAQWYRRSIKNPNHQVKELPSTLAFDADFIFSPGTVMLNHYENQNMVTLKIRHKGFHQSMMALFNYLWERL